MTRSGANGTTRLRRVSRVLRRLGNVPVEGRIAFAKNPYEDCPISFVEITPEEYTALGTPNYIRVTIDPAENPAS